MDRYIDDLEQIAQKSALYSASRVPNETRKYSGQAQASTKMSIGAMDLSVVLADVYAPNAISNSIGLAVNQFKRVSSQIKLGDVVFISNNLPYIAVVEFEYGDLMFNKAMKAWEQDVERAVNDTV